MKNLLIRLLIGPITAALEAAVIWFAAQQSAKKDAEIEQLNDKIKARDLRESADQRARSLSDPRKQLRDDWSE